jgi:hypothetical protein
MTTIPRRALVPLAALGAACGGGWFTGAPRPLPAAPDAFAVDTTFHRTVRTPPDGACLTHLVDPRDGTTLVLAQAQGGLGDYDVTPAGRYGLSARERLRVACATRAAQGAVPR